MLVQVVKPPVDPVDSRHDFVLHPAVAYELDQDKQKQTSCQYDPHFRIKVQGDSAQNSDEKRQDNKTRIIFHDPFLLSLAFDEKSSQSHINIEHADK